MFVINDGRPATQSNFNDTVARKAFELYLIGLLKVNNYQVVSQGERQELNASQRSLVSSLRDELVFLLLKRNVIAKVPEEAGQEEVFQDELRKALEKTKRKIQQWGKYEAVIDNQKVFIRPSSKKPKGWQITFRGRKTGSPMDSLQKGDDYLLVPRNGILPIPLPEVQKAIRDRRAYEQDTIDIWIVFEESRVTLSYRDNTVDVTRFKLVE